MLAKPEAPDGAAPAKSSCSRSPATTASTPRQPLQRPNGATSTTAGPLEALLRFNPAERHQPQAGSRLRHPVRRDHLDRLHGQLRLRRAADYLGATWFTRTQPSTGESVSNQVRLNGAFGISPLHLRVEGADQLRLRRAAPPAAALRRHLHRPVLRPAPGAARLPRRRRARAPATRTSASRSALKNVGTFLDLNSRSSTVEP